MKYFICALENKKINLGISAKHTQRIIQAAKIQAVEYEAESKEIFVSLPALLQQKNTDAPHGIVLKTEHKKRIVLLTPRIDIDLEIPEENISRLPDAFVGLYGYFRGVCFHKESLILILNIEKILEGIQ